MFAKTVSTIVLALVLAIGAGATSSGFAADPLNWANNALFARDVDREDIKQVLKSALEKGGMDARFDAGVEGRITEKFSNVHAQGVFNMVVETFGLDYSLDAGTNIVTVFQSPAVGATGAASSQSGAGDRATVTMAAATTETSSGQSTEAKAESGDDQAARANTARGLQWKQVSFERTSFEEDIRDVFRAIAQANDMQVLFRPDVEGEISFEFQNMDLRAAFRKLIAENGLDFSYDAESNTVTLFKAVSVQRRECTASRL